MCHDGDMSLSNLANLIHEFKHLVGIIIRQKALRPKCQAPGSDAKILDVRKELGIFEGLKISAKKSRLHDHGITASEENISDLRVIFEVGEEAFSITLRKFQV
jgi:ribulose-5-phosphate 4-epimerase/fuculose-1-phosphate aldolase